MPKETTSADYPVRRMHPIFSTVRLGGLPIAISNLETAAQRLCDFAADESRQVGGAVHLVNAYTIALADKNPSYAAIFDRSSANLPDGRPLVWIGRVKRHALHQVRGPSLFGAIVDKGRASGVTHFLLGATEETLSLLREELERRYPGVAIVGEFSPPFRDVTAAEELAQDKAIRESGAQIVWVGLGTPKQDIEVARLSRSLPVLAVAIGAAFDFVAGTKKEAPEWMSRLGIEWLFRFISEPKRLWRRYLYGNVRFLSAVIRRT